MPSGLMERRDMLMPTGITGQMKRFIEYFKPMDETSFYVEADGRSNEGHWTLDLTNMRSRSIMLHVTNTNAGASTKTVLLPDMDRVWILVLVISTETGEPGVLVQVGDRSSTIAIASSGVHLVYPTATAVVTVALA